MRDKIKHVYLQVDDETSDLSTWGPVLESLYDDVKISIVLTEKKILKELETKTTVMMPEKALRFMDDIAGIVEIDPSIIIYGDKMPAVNPKIVRPLNLNNIGKTLGVDGVDVEEGDSESEIAKRMEENWKKIDEEIERMIVSILQGEKILIKIDFRVRKYILDKVMLDPRIKERKPDFVIGNIVNILNLNPELLDRLQSYNIGKLIIGVYGTGVIDLSMLKEGKFDLEFESRDPDIRMHFDPANYRLTVTHSYETNK
mgnify:FL=1